MILLTFLGPEYLGRKFGVAHDDDMNEATGDRVYQVGSSEEQSAGEDSKEKDERSGIKLNEKIIAEDV